MRSKIHSCPFALAADGTSLVNAALFDEVESAEEILERAMAEPGRIFIGITLTEQDMKLVTPRMADACNEASAFVIGRRQRLARRR